MEYQENLVSIIIPTHNRADMIIETLMSVINQSYKEFELIIVDDHSIDETEQVIKSFQEKYSDRDIVYIKSEKKGGCAARNLGLSLAKGCYVQFFDDDDIMYEDYIKSRVDVMKKKKCDYVACNYNYFDSDTGKIIRKVNVASIDHSIQMHIFFPALTTQLFLLSRKCVNIIGKWGEQIKRCQDMAYFHRLFLYECKGEWMNEELFSLRIHSNRITNNTSRGYLDCINALESIRGEWKKKNNKSLNNIITHIQFHLIRNINNNQSHLMAIYVFCRLSILHCIDILRLLWIGIRNKSFKLTYSPLKVEAFI